MDTPTLDYKKMVTEIDEMVSIDFCEEMEVKSITTGKGMFFSHEDSVKMAQLLARVYSVAHCVHCGACNKKYRINNKK